MNLTKQMMKLLTCAPTLFQLKFRLIGFKFILLVLKICSLEYYKSIGN